MLLADEFFLTAHDDVSGKCRLYPLAMGLGLAAALLGELLLDQKIALERGNVTVIGRGWPEDTLSRSVLSDLVQHPSEREAQTWLRFLSKTAHERVAQRLLLSGQVRRVAPKWWRSSQHQYQPVNPNIAALPMARLSTLGTGEQLQVSDIVLGGLLRELGLSHFVLQDAPARAEQELTQLISGLPQPLFELVAQTKTAVGAAVLGGRM